ncbi:MAG: hypothetical protein JXB10_11945 [Pirellulales bacterium]|nr:hypothetical protein [Pirellulales bacterium]
MQPRFLHYRRSGNIIVLTSLLMVAMVGMLAFAVDLGYVQVVGTELQRAADAAAIAATWELMDQNLLTNTYNPAVAEQNARNFAAEYAQRNLVGGTASNLAVEDVVIGHLMNPSNPAEAINTGYAGPSNAVQVRVRRTAAENGEIPLFFARALGVNSLPNQAAATAAFMDNFSGFKPPSNGNNLGVLPFALDQYTWNRLLQGIGTDFWTWDPVEQRVKPGPDGVLEVNLYPQDTGAPGNRGTVDIGSSNNSTADIARQILHGVSPADLARLGGELKLNEEGKLYLNGDPGISAGMKDELASIKGKPRTILIFSDVTGPGNNATYTIVQFAGIRIMEVKLTGSMSSKRVIIQPAFVEEQGGIPSDDPEKKSYFVTSPVWLVR